MGHWNVSLAWSRLVHYRSHWPVLDSATHCLFFTIHNLLSSCFLFPFFSVLGQSCVCECASGDVRLRPFQLELSVCLLQCHLFGQVSPTFLAFEFKVPCLVSIFLCYSTYTFSFSEVAGHVICYFLVCSILVFPSFVFWIFYYAS